jgi:hypothetical protein
MRHFRKPLAVCNCLDQVKSIDYDFRLVLELAGFDWVFQSVLHARCRLHLLYPTSGRFCCGDRTILLAPRNSTIDAYAGIKCGH